MAILVESTDAAFNAQLKNFAKKIDGYSSLLGLTPEEVQGIKADAAVFDYLLGNQLAVQTFAVNYTAFKNQFRKGGDFALGGLPPLPVFGEVPARMVSGAEVRFRNLLQRISHSPAYTTAMGEDLGIEAAASPFDPQQGKPAFFIELSSGGYPNLRWTKGKFQGIEIWKDGGTGFVKLDRDFSPDYIDKSPLPPVGQTAVWKYKAIYLMKDEPVGAWSDVVGITVFGEV